MQDHRKTSSGDRAGRVIDWLEPLLLIAGATALIWCGIIVADRFLAQREARTGFEAALPAEEELVEPPPAPPPSPPPETGVQPREQAVVRARAAIAALSIPRVQLSAMVLQGSDARTLLRGPGHLEHTADPGDGGNVVIAGHRDSFFRPLRHVQLGDDIFLQTRKGRFHYRVTSLRVVEPHEVSVIAPTSDEVLTLITCYPFTVIGHAPDRFIVRAARVADGAAPLLDARTLPVDDWAEAPTLDQVTATAPVTPRAAKATDDDTLVRQTVGRYLLAQGSSSFTCAVAVNDDLAAADCEPSAPTASGHEQPGRRFSLERAHDAWAIKSIEVKDPLGWR